MDQFWQTVSDFCGIKWLGRGAGNAYTPPPPPRTPSAAAAVAAVAALRSSAGGAGGDRGQERGGVMTDARWFEGAKLNFAHNLIPPPTDDEVWICFVSVGLFRVRAFLCAELWIVGLRFFLSPAAASYAVVGKSAEATALHSWRRTPRPVSTICFGSVIISSTCTFCLITHCSPPRRLFPVA